MAPLTPTGIPSSVKAGDSWIWRVADFADFPYSEGWSLSYAIAGVGYLAVPDADKPESTVAYATSGDDAGFWVTTIVPAHSKIPAGRYRIVGRMTGSGAYAGKVYTVSDETLVVSDDPAEATKGEFQSHAEKMLAIIEEEIEARITGNGSAHESYVIEGRQISKIPIEKLTQMRGKYAAEVRRLRSGRVGRQIKTEFGRV